MTNKEKAKEAYKNYISNAEYKQGKSEQQTFMDGFLAGVATIPDATTKNVQIYERMTNEEKAVGIGLHVRDLCLSKGVTRDNAETASLLAQQSVMEMAKWKDQQFKEYLEKKIYDIEHGPDTDFEGQMMEDDEIYLLKEIINELFGGE